jgi:[glutamine synthetase] adenylyltransferase / [glutamine synthetase]-adenylyl-L-tyrosine phosphorylase
MLDNALSPDILADIPEALRGRVEQHWLQLAEKCSDFIIPVENHAEVVRVLALSDFVAQSLIRDPQLLPELLTSGDLWCGYAESEYVGTLQQRLEKCPNENQLGEILRRYRRREMVRIAWRDLAGHADLQETIADLSHLADACIDAALGFLYRWYCELWGTPYSANGEKQQMVVIGMGKLGAFELNFSSDVDLIFSYPEDGETRGGRGASNQEFFIKLGQALIRTLDTATAQGFVFRVDMRLRPFGESSALAISFDAMEDYYQTHGREWERYAMVKARIVAGDREAGAELLALLKPFVYRKYVDFGAFESLREMKAMIAREVQRKGMADNIKLGAGGIREVEFIGQAFQLIHGGREPSLQIRPILPVLEQLHKLGQLPPFVVDELTEAYTFLRNSEHRLQEFAEQQTHKLPGDELSQLRLAFGMGYADWPGYEKALNEHRRRVHEHFEQVFAAPQTDHAESDELDLRGIWLEALDETASLTALQQIGFTDTTEALRLLRAQHRSRAYLNMSTQGRNRIDQLMPLLLGAVGATSAPDDTLRRVLQLMEAIGRRSAYIALLVENPMALSQLVRLCAASPWIAAHLGRNPHLLDELLDPRSLYAPPSREAIQAEVRERLAHLDVEDMEGQMDVLRRVKQAAVLRVAAADIVEAVPLMVVSDHLTEIAEVMVEASFDLAWQHLTLRHGRPHCDDSRVCDSGFAVIAYGKMGGIELSYGSDLDLVFLHSEESGGRSTDGEKPVENGIFYARLAQRMIHILNTPTPAGILYEVDTRLRPSGASGLLVSNVDAFADYQRKHAWTWEHQALVRARHICGDSGIAEAFANIRAEILGQSREIEQLRTEVREMREKMRTQLSKAEAGKFDLKQDQGGIADIEFMVQYGVLAWANEHPRLLQFSDNIRLLELFAGCGLMAGTDSELLRDAYRAFRIRVHRLTLQEQKAVVDAAEFTAERDGVLRIWHALLDT